MSGENHCMQLRPRRSVLADISNRASLGNTTAVDAAVKASTRTKRLRSSLDGDVAAPTGDTKIVKEIPSSSSSSSTTRSSTTSAKEHEHKRVRGVPSIPEKQEVLPLHVIARTLPIYKNASNPANCLDMIDRMYNIYYEIEDKCSAKPYMVKQKDINQKMRSILIDWLIEVHNKFKLQPQTLWLSVNILDRYLEKNQILRTKLQLVGISSLLIASKYEEIYPPEVKDCVYITDNAYDRQEVLLMETTILTSLEYRITVPTGYHFLTRYLNCIQASDRTRNLASYYAERNLQESDMLCVPPHKFAAAAVYAALAQQNQNIARLTTCPVWGRILEEESGLSELNLKPCARNIISHVREESETASKRRLVATKKKYGGTLFSGISLLPLPRI